MNVTEISMVSFVSVRDDNDREIRYPVGKYITRSVAKDLVTSGKIIQVLFRKKNGMITSRNVICDAKEQRSHSPYVVAKDIHKLRIQVPPYINIKVDNIIGVVTKGYCSLVQEAVCEHD